jgi:hypothetical protein
MKEQNEWVFFEEIEWGDKKFNKFSVDTRDFHCGYTWAEQHKDLAILNKYPQRFLHTEQELKDTLSKLYKDSGGKGKWRMLSFEPPHKHSQGWALKYLRIFRTEQGLFVICNDDGIALTKELLSREINQEFLGHH